VTCDLVNYPGFGTDTGSGNIYIQDPCESPFSVTIATPYTDTFTYDSVTPVNFVFPTVTISPPIVCDSQAEYTCQYIGGPYSGNFNLCDFSYSNGALAATGDFNPLNGGYTFSSNAIDIFPPGIYNFEATVTVGDTEVVAPFTITISDPCAGASLSILNNPFASGLQYVLGDAANVFVFDNSVILSGTPVDCGKVVIEILDQGTNLPPVPVADPDFYNLDTTNDGANEFTLGPSDVLGLVGTDTLVFRAYYEKAPGNTVTSPPFDVEIIDPCDPPAGYTPLPQIVASSPVD
jgi:hypothetical protein